MDLRLLIQALARHKIIAAVGVSLAVALAVFSHVRVDPFGEGPTFKYRKDVLWGSSVVMQITQPGFYEGRVITDPGRRATLLELAPLYARLANSDPVRARMRRDGPIYGKIFSQAIVDENGSGVPLIELIATARQVNTAKTRASRQARAFIGYLRAQQVANKVPERQRLSLAVIQGPTNPVLAVPRKKTLPVVVFMSMLLMTAAAVLIADNAGKRRVRSADDGDPGAGSADAESDLPRVIPRAAQAGKRAPKPGDIEAATRGPRPQRATLGNRGE